MMPEVPQPQGLISVLLAADAELGDRHDAAMDLGAFNEESAEAALIKTVTNLAEDQDIVDAAAESLREIWSRKNKTIATVVSRMHPAAKPHFE